MATTRHWPAMLAISQRETIKFGIMLVVGTGAPSLMADGIRCRISEYFGGVDYPSRR